MPGRRTARFLRFLSVLLVTATVVVAVLAALPLFGAAGESGQQTAFVSDTSSNHTESPDGYWLETSSTRSEPVAQPSVVATPTAEVGDEAAAVVATATPEPAVNPPVAPITDEAAPVATPIGPVERWASKGFVIVREGQELDNDSLASIDQALSDLPPWLRNVITHSDLGPIYILVNTEGQTLSGRRPYGRAANFFYTNDGMNELVLYPHQSAQTVLHELGHAYNLRTVAAGRYAMVLLDPEMESFMAATGWQIDATIDEVKVARDHTEVPMTYTGPKIWTRLSHDDPLEDFANSFALYFYSPGDLRALSPARFDWFETYVGR
jgi:hypothetical protein